MTGQQQEHIVSQILYVTTSPNAHSSFPFNRDLNFFAPDVYGNGKQRGWTSILLKFRMSYILMLWQMAKQTLIFAGNANTSTLVLELRKSDNNKFYFNRKVLAVNFMLLVPWSLKTRVKSSNFFITCKTHNFGWDDFLATWSITVQHG